MGSIHQTGSQSGGPNARNTEYHLGLALLLARLKVIRAEITDAILDSVRVRLIAEDQRRLPLTPPFTPPIILDLVSDLERLRRALQSAQPGVLRTPGEHQSHGNGVRAIRLFLTLAPSPALNAHQLQDYLVTGVLPGPKVDEPTADPDELQERVRRIRSRGRVARPEGNPNPHSVDTRLGRRVVRSPCVVAWVLQRAEGRCELCAKVPFLNLAGEPYLEVHHIDQLAQGGPDTPENCAGVCADCHRELHFGAAREVRAAGLRARVAKANARDAGMLAQNPRVTGPP